MKSVYRITMAIKNMGVCNPFRNFRLMTVCLVLLSTACKQKSNGQSVSEAQENSTKEESTLYQSSVFTEPSGFTGGIEGPAVDANGILYVVNFEKQGTIGQVDAVGNASLFVTLPEGSIGNGIRFNSAGDMFIADYTMHNVLKVDMDTKEISVYAHNDELNQPNDIAIMDNDIIFASDPDWANSKGQIWRVKEGTFTLLEGDMGTTNGIEVSPDNKTLYVNESVQRNIWAYDLSPEGEISNKRLLTKFEDFGMDGMRTDADGNLYVTRHGKGTVAKISTTTGEILEEIPLTGKKASNIAFGGEEGTQAFITLQDNGNVETFTVESPGRAFQMIKERKE
ncbi:SMP-30/gluconolactonase/LRE family protein [Flagellimonas olearia]|uniref:SMP-30/gluconolactonase/LRE family protein n=1 Tax=Flagellimonas olearia TaxID=552546 RepID=UPI001A911FAF|nr:SMP-30/gluconolactonase/LRE family protein [Allomuricauda olearia]